MYGEDIKAVQNRLNSLGYNAGTADGYYGNGTRTAVINFQTAKGLDADGDVGPTTWNALFNTSNSGGSGYSRILKLTSPLMYGEDIRAVQNKLNSLGYNAGTADGYYGNDTRTAVISFQTARGIDIDGEVGPTTWKTLFNTSTSGGNGSTSNIRKVLRLNLADLQTNMYHYQIELHKLMLGMLIFLYLYTVTQLLALQLMELNVILIQLLILQQNHCQKIWHQH